jgi:tetratricopeptide (TPR) repeat protein/tRNA A-37 threonylcarbamoyl transferase component Bud32
VNHAHGAADQALTQTLTGFAGGRYSLVRMIGMGAEKIVYLVRDTALDRECALALLRSEKISTDAAARFRTEAQAMARLGAHPHIVTLFDIGIHDGAHFVVSEHLAGGDLASALRAADGHLPVGQVIDTARQMLRALAFSHLNGVVHCDLKPANVWLTPDGVAKLGDFGIAQLAGRADRKNHVVGTLAYMSPEQLRGEDVDGRTDLYALGCTMFELLSGAPPFTGTSDQVIAGHLSDPPPAIEGPGLESVEPVIRALLAKRREDRPATAEDVLRMLDDAQMPSQAHGDVTRAAAHRWEASLREALERRDVDAALGVLQSTLAAGPDPEARMALGKLLLVADPLASRQALELCVQEFSAAGLNRRAAVASAAVAASYASGDGNRVAARPWLQRAWRLVRDEGPCVERGWVAVCDIACNTDDPRLLREHCDVALEMARRFGDVALEAKALADGGCALVQLGEVAGGTAYMDEALAIVTSGQVADPVVTAEILCAFFTLVAITSDLARCEAWSHVFRERGLTGESAHPITTSHCDCVHGGLLCKLGRFTEAESKLARANEDARGTIYAGRLHPLSSLAELRIQQGRLSEAEDLLRGHDDFIEPLMPLANLHLARREFDLAAATARQALRLMGADRTRAVSLLCVLVEAELGRGNLAAAQTACALLDDRVAGTSLPALAAEAALVRAKLRNASGDRAGAIVELEDALSASMPLQIGPLNARLHLALARLHRDTDPGAAQVEARAAAAVLARLDTVVPEEDLAFLRAVGA